MEKMDLLDHPGGLYEKNEIWFAFENVVNDW